MRIVVWVLLLAAVAVVTAGALGANDGIVTLQWQGWVVDLSLNFFLLALLAVCLLVYALVQTLDSLLGMPRRAQRWRVSRRDRTAQAALRESLGLLLAARYTRAYKQAQRAIEIQALTPDLEPDAEFNSLGHLLAASSLHRLQDRTRRDEHLARAIDHAGHARGAQPCEEAARLLSAEWALDDRDAVRALRELSQMPPGLARRTQALRLKLQAARLAGQPLEALRTARLLAKHQGLSSVAAEGLVRSLAIESLETARDADQMRRQWQALDQADRRDPFVAARAATQMAAAGAAEEARGWLRPLWDKLPTYKADEHQALALALADASAGLEADWVGRIEAALQARPRDPVIAYTAGRCLAERQLWGKARRLFEVAAPDATLAAGRRREAWLFLARLAEQEQRTEEAERCFRQAAACEG